MQMKLELVPVPVSDIDRAKAFYVEQVGFHADLDVRPGDTVRIVQLTPPGSACSIVISTGLHLVVGDIYRSREALVSRGVEVSEVDEHEQGVKYASFSDPDGNTWALQEMPWRSEEF